MIEFLLLDLDDTVLDFHGAERAALRRTLERFGLEPSEEILSRYHQINQWHWEQLEKGLLTRPQVLLGRFRMLFQQFGLAAEPEKIAACYESSLAQGHDFLPGAQETLQILHGRYRLFLVSNGTAAVQHRRLEDAGLYPLFERVFISQEVGFHKPSREFFDKCFGDIPGFCRNQALMVGDSLTSDILGGINAGVRTVWVNPEHKPCGDIRPDYEIPALRDLPRLIEEIEGGTEYGGI